MAKTSNIQTGLTNKQVTKLLKKYGHNEFPQKKEWTALKIIFSQFTSFLIIILIAAGSVSYFLNETIDAIAIFAIVLINAIIGFIQEYKAENAVKALKKMVVPKTIVIRNSKEQEISVVNLVPGDLVKLSEGDKIPADMRLIEAFSLKVDEAVLTGESVPSNKSTKGKERERLLFKGTIVTTGRAIALVTSTGLKTEFGKIVDLVSKTEKSRSPLTLQLDTLGKRLGLIILVLIAILFALGYMRGISVIEMFMTSVALGVSAIPEGMPIIVTLTLAMGVQVLAGKKAIVRKMNSIETLGATTIICSDKTGTLTLNEMTVKKICTNFKEVDIPGQGYTWKKSRISLTTPEEKRLLEICENCNSSFVDDKTTLGDPTEIALKVLSRKASYVKTYKELDEKVFTSERKMMSSLHKIGKKDRMVMTKGAMEEVIKKCTHVLKKGKIRKITSVDKIRYKKIANKYAKDALRVLGFAYKIQNKGFTENSLVFVGIVGMVDPPRETVKQSIKIAQEAHIKIKIITGDNAITARAVGEKIGLKVTNVVTGKQIDKMTDAELQKVLKTTQIFARTKPEHKYRIVDILKKDREVVAVTGDGVNDAPALKHSDVGIAMGIKGTEATKEVADIVLKDDNFSTIITTIEEGRRIYHNILAFIKYMLSANFDTIMAVGILTILGFPLPILPLQILWINIATDALPALALGSSPASEGIMKEKPHKKAEGIFKKFFLFIATAAVLQTIVNLMAYFYGLSIDTKAAVDIANLAEPSHARTLVFTQIVMFELFFVFVCKEEKALNIKAFLSNKKLIGAVALSFGLQLMMIYAPFMQSIFKTVPLTVSEWILVTVFASTAFMVPGLSKFVKKHFRRMT